VGKKKGEEKKGEKRGIGVGGVKRTFVCQSGCELKVHHHVGVPEEEGEEEVEEEADK